MVAKKVLIIDDEATVKQAMKKALKNEGYDLLFANDGEEGLKIVKKTPPDLIFLDLRMPVMDGLEFLKKLKVKYEDPYFIVVITGHGDDKDIAKCYDLGITNFLRKPLSMTEICALAKRCLEGKKIEAELKNYRDNLEKVVAQQTKKIQDQLQFLETLINANPAPIYFKDTNLKITGCNNAFADWVNIPKDQLMGRKFENLFSKSVAKKEREKDLALLKSGGTQSYNSRLQFNDDSHKDVCYCKALFKMNGKKTAGIVGTIFDITDREEAMRKLDDKSKSLNQANMSLRILIKQLSDAQEERVGNFPNLKELVLPSKDQLNNILSSPTERAYIDNIMLNLNRVTSTFAKKLSQMNLGLSPKEIQVADLIRIGLSNKESALQMNVTKSTIEFHRDNLRRKLNLKHEKKNLRAYLMALDASMSKD